MGAVDLETLEYPRHLHMPSVPGNWVYRIVQDAEECAAALREGWSLVPILIDPARPTPPPAPLTRGRKR